MVPENHSDDQLNDTSDQLGDEPDMDGYDAFRDEGEPPGWEHLPDPEEAPAQPVDEKPYLAQSLEHMGMANDLSNHLRVAHMVAAKSLGKLLHVAGLGWFAWDGKRFVPDLGDKRAKLAVRDGLLALIPPLKRQLATAYANDDDAEKDRLKAVLADLSKAQSGSGVAGVLTLMASLEDITADVEDLDADPLLLNVDNGVLDLRELEPGEDGEPVDWRSLTLHPHDPKYRMTQITRSRFSPEAVAEVWTKFLDRSLPELSIRDYLHRAVGVGLIGEQLEHLLPILSGAGRNGKGVLYGALDYSLGSYSHVASPSLFAAVKGDPNKPQPAFLTLRGKRLVWVSETNKNAEMDSALIKRLTGGDPITGRGLHQNNEVTFDPSHQLMLITNHAPQLPADDPAVWARVQCVHWGVVIPAAERDPNLGKKLKSRNEMDAVLAWALEGLAKYNHEGMAAPESVTAATDAYKADQDTVSRFVTERCDDDCPENDGDGTKTLHADYKRFCRANGVMEAHQLGERDFAARLTEMGYAQVKSNGRRFWKELKVLPSDMEARATESQLHAAAKVQSMIAAYDQKDQAARQPQQAPAEQPVSSAPAPDPCAAPDDLAQRVSAQPEPSRFPRINSTEEQNEKIRELNAAPRQVRAPHAPMPEHTDTVKDRIAWYDAEIKRMQQQNNNNQNEEK